MIDGLAPMYRMPVSFGPAPGPRNLPAAYRQRRYDKTVTTLSLSATTDPEAICHILPAGFTLVEPARIEVVLLVLSDIGWLAGRGYNIAMIRIPARWRGQETVTGHFVPVLWENMADPILTGREELGWPKIFADISGQWRASASWEGFTFLEIAAHGFAPAEPPAPALPMMFHKYIPKTGEWGQTDVDCITATAPDGPQPAVTSVLTGTGSFAFRQARWEDMPTQYPIVNALAGLPLLEFGPASLVRTAGGGDASGQRVLA